MDGFFRTISKATFLRWEFLCSQFQFDLMSSNFLWSFSGFIVSCLVQPLHINETVKIDTETISLDNEENLQARRKLFENEWVLANLRKLIPYYDVDWGCLIEPLISIQNANKQWNKEIKITIFFLQKYNKFGLSKRSQHPTLKSIKIHAYVSSSFQEIWFYWNFCNKNTSKRLRNMKIFQTEERTSECFLLQTTRWDRNTVGTK